MKKKNKFNKQKINKKNLKSKTKEIQYLIKTQIKIKKTSILIENSFKKE